MMQAELPAQRVFPPTSRSRPQGFTLIEVMVVVSILGIVMAISIPTIQSIKKRGPMIQTIHDIREVCSHARARAVFSGQTTEVVFRPQERTFALSGGGGASGSAPKGSGKTQTSGSIHEDLMLEMLDVNLMEFRDAPLAVVRFYPNGTCDELTIILRSPKNLWRKISFEATTGLSTVGAVE